jgi:hypothetical protein
MLHRLARTPAQLRTGCVLATLAHAIFTAHSPELANEQSWDGQNYNVQDSQGAIGTVTFGESRTLGAFFDSHSERNPISHGTRDAQAALLSEMPTDVTALANRETLQYLLQEYEGTTVPLVTSVFWSDDESFVAPEPWQEAFSNGAHLVRNQLRPANEAIEIWRSHYEFSTQEVTLLRSLFAEATERSGTTVMSKDEKAVLLARGDEGLQQSRDLFAGVGIAIPD